MSHRRFVFPGSLHELEYSGIACQGTTFIFTCPRGYYINILSGFYGRSELESCDPGDIGVETTNCSLGGAVGIIRRECDRRERCELPVTSETFTDDPCPDTIKYMRVEFVCRGRYISVWGFFQVISWYNLYHRAMCNSQR